MEKEHIKMAAIIYSKLLCPYCEMAKKLLEEKNIPYKELIIGVDISKEKAFEELDAIFTTAPQIEIGRASCRERV